MRKLNALILILAFMLSGAGIAVLDDSRPSGYSIRENSINVLEMEFNVDKIGFEEVKTEKGTFTRLKIENGYHTYDTGSPELPRFHELIAMPYGAEPQIEVIGYETKAYKLSDLGIKYPVYPAQPSYSKSSKPEERIFVYNETAYRSSKLAGKPSVSAEKSGTMRGVGIGRLEVLPFSYNAEAGTLEVYNNIMVRVNFTHAHPSAEEKRKDEYSPFFEDALKSLVNYVPPKADIKEGLLNFPVTYLIVANNNLNENADLNRFIEWKKSKGFNIITNYVAASTTISTIDTWIEDQYNTLDPKPSFVLIVGDHDGTYGVLSEVNPAIGSGGSVTRSDLLYSVIGAVGTGNRIPSMYIGRFSVRSTAELAAQVDKTIWYEKEQFDTNLNPGQDFTYLTKGMGVAGADATYQASHGNPHISYQMNYFFNDTYTNPFTGGTNGMTGIGYYNGASGQATNIVNNVSTGLAWYNYTAHGAETVFADPSFTISNVEGLTNIGKYPLVIGNCCLTGSFGTAECFGESWLNAANKGGIGYIGASMSTYWDEDLAFGIGSGGTGLVNSGYTNPASPPPFTPSNKGSVDHMMMSNHPTQGSVRHVALLAVETYGGTRVGWYWSAYHLFGDPSLMLVMGHPQTITASYDPIIPGSTSYSVTTEPYAYVAISKGGVLHGAAEANASGVATITITPFSPGDTGDIVVTARFSKPYYGQAFCTGDIGGTFSINQSSLSYGNVDAGSTSVQQFIITNSHGSEYLTGDITTPAGYSVAQASKEYTKDAKNTLSYAVAPQSSKTFNLTFAPTAGQTYSGNVVVTSTDTGHSTQNIAVTGTGIVPNIGLSVASLNATTAPESSTNKTFDIINSGLGTLNYSLSVNYTDTKDLKASGEDSFGYKWKDSDETGGPVYSWVDITGVGTNMGFTGIDQTITGVSLGFDFNFYGDTFSSVNVCSNGWISFTSSATTFTNVTIPSTADPNNLIAPYWDDLDPSSSPSGAIYYYRDAANSRFIVSYVNIENYSSTTMNTFQIILYQNGKIVFQYNTMNGSKTSCTVGIENATGSVGSLVNYNTAYLKNNFAIQFQATPEWLTLDKTSGTVLSGKLSDTITATCNAEGLEVGTYSADITVSSNDPDEPSKVIPVTFNVAYGETGGVFAVNQSSLNYGSVSTGNTSVKQFTITNSHSSQYLMGNITTIDGYSVAASAKEQAKNVLSYTVSPNSSKTFDLTFAPVVIGSYNGNITISSSDPSHPTNYIAVSGSGMGPGLPFAESFENATYAPTGWSIVDVSGTAGDWTRVTSGTYPTCSPQDGSAMSKFNSYNASAGSKTRLATPQISFAGNSNVTLTFQMYVDTGYSTANDSLEVYVSANGTDWTKVKGYKRYSTTNGWSAKSVDLSAFDGQSVYIGFMGCSAYGNNIYMDNVSITGTQTAPGAPSNVATGISGSDLTITWAAVSGATSYDVYSSDDPYGTFTVVANVSTNSYTTPYSAAKKFWYVVAKN